MPLGQVNINQFSGLKAVYHLSDVNDATANAFNLTNNNSCTFIAAKFGNGVDLGSANSNKSLSIADNLGIDGGNITLSCWVKLNAEITSGIWGVVSQQSTTSKVEYLIAYEYNGGGYRIAFDRVKQGVANNQSFFVSGSLGLSQWHHLTLTYDGSLVSGYFDGKVSEPTSSSGDGSAASSSGFSIGSDFGAGPGNYASVVVDEVFVTNTALTTKQIKDYYAWALGRRTGSP